MKSHPLLSRCAPGELHNTSGIKLLNCKVYPHKQWTRSGENTQSQAEFNINQLKALQCSGLLYHMVQVEAGLPAAPRPQLNAKLILESFL